MAQKKNNLEIEKRYLLRRLPPKIDWDEIQRIDQFYTPKGRFRCAQPKIANVFAIFLQTNKKSISHGVNEEIEKEISEKQFYKELKTATRKISKIRYIKKFKNLIWEVDVFNYGLVIAE